MTWRFRIAKSFSSTVQDGGHGGNLETLQIKSDSEFIKIDLIAKMATMAQCNIIIMISVIQVSDFWLSWASVFLFFFFFVIIILFYFILFYFFFILYYFLFCFL